MTDRLTHGATRSALIANGYFPCAANGQSGYRYADEVGALLLIPQYGSSRGSPNVDANLGAVTICLRNPKARAAVVQIIGAKGLSKSPYRKDSGENITFIFAVSFYDGPFSRQTERLGGELDPAAAFDTCTRDGFGNCTSRVVTIGDAASWTNGSPLTVRYSSLPKLGSDEIDALMTEIERELSKHHTASAPVEAAQNSESATTTGTVYGRPPMEPWSANGAINPKGHANPWDSRGQR